MIEELMVRQLYSSEVSVLVSFDNELNLNPGSELWVSLNMYLNSISKAG